MPAKKRENVTSDAERRQRLEATAREIGTSDAPRAFKQAFDRVVRPPPKITTPLKRSV